MPLPSTGHHHVDRGIRRVLVEVPAGCPLRADDVYWAFSGLELVAPEIGADHPLMITPSADETCVNDGVISSGPVSNLKIIGRNQLPSGIRLSILAFLAFLIVFFVQALSTGRWLPQLDREVAVLEAYEAGVASIQAGGLSLLCYQILNRVSGFALLFLGLGFGLICAKYTSRKGIFLAAHDRYAGAVRLARYLYRRRARRGPYHYACCFGFR